VINLKKVIRNVPDFPISGVQYKDITSVLHDPKAFQHSVDVLTAYCRSKDITDIIAPDARGFIWGSPVAYKMGLPLHLVRKEGKLPPPVNSYSYDLEYGSAVLELTSTTSFNVDSRVCIIDDVSATGGTAMAIVELLKQAGASNIDYACVIDLTFLGGSAKLRSAGINTHTLVEYND
jgi:adenine phosphoribosyltransferase